MTARGTNRPAGHDLAEMLLAELSAFSLDPPGHTRIAYGAGEQQAHDTIRAAAEVLGATARADAAGNLYLTLAGRRPDLPAIMLGSHLDTVPHGGNFDGAAGVVAGIGVMAELVQVGLRPPRDLVVMAIRAEEAAWFPLSYPGSRAAFGQLGAAELDTRRSDSGKMLAHHMRVAGFDPDTVAAGVPQIDPARLACFIEVHIEQGPRLIRANAPVGLVTGIAGGCRFPRARILGAYGHSGAEPHFARRDAVVGFAELVLALEAEWNRIETEGKEATLTFGRVESDPSQHGGSRVLGELGFTLDLRTGDDALLERLVARVSALCEEIGARHGLTFDLGVPFNWDSARMNGALIGRLEAAARQSDLAPPHMLSGAGHDAVTFAANGIPAAMIFVRNAHGSHNPDEAMEVADLHAAIRLLTRFVLDFDRT
ncbi:MAG: hydantoinase/carbamoylase family amidase [Gemmobacter sp.]|jgi:N-carbamoyl-L-amino-acid hydrolase|nr:hydantoinase/carbamoylase family amidase [Gemmobacter sp.]